MACAYIMLTEHMAVPLVLQRDASAAARRKGSAFG